MKSGLTLSSSESLVPQHRALLVQLLDLGGVAGDLFELLLHLSDRTVPGSELASLTFGSSLRLCQILHGSVAIAKHPLVFIGLFGQ